MEEKEMLKVLTYEDRKIMIEGENLVELAQMYHLSVPDFLNLAKHYLGFTQVCINGSYVIRTIEDEVYVYSKNEIFSKTSGEILVSADIYEEMKKRLFDFAYTKCSEIGSHKFDKWGLSCTSIANPYFQNRLTSEPDTYSCIYSSAKGGWNEKISDVKINHKDQEKRYSLIKR